MTVTGVPEAAAVPSISVLPVTVKAEASSALPATLTVTGALNGVPESVQVLWKPVPVNKSLREGLLETRSSLPDLENQRVPSSPTTVLAPPAWMVSLPRPPRM